MGRSGFEEEKLSFFLKCVLTAEHVFRYLFIRFGYYDLCYIFWARCEINMLWSELRMKFS